jgi:hypothetical protein
MGPSSALVRGVERKLGKITRPESSADFSPVIGHFRLFDLSIDHIIDAYPRTANLVAWRAVRSPNGWPSCLRRVGRFGD